MSLFKNKVCFNVLCCVCNLVNEAIVKQKAKADEQKRIKCDKPVKLKMFYVEFTAKVLVV